jgi:protein-disulfide isomerase
MKGIFPIMKQKDFFVGVSFFTLALGLGFMISQTPPMDAAQLAQMEPAAGEEAPANRPEMAVSSAQSFSDLARENAAENKKKEQESAVEQAKQKAAKKAQSFPRTAPDEPSYNDKAEKKSAPKQASESTQSIPKDYQYTLKEALSERSIGSPDAPFVIREYSSLSCPHCAQFHERTFPHIKEKLIDTGKVRWVFSPFPTNDPALMGVMLAHCVHPQRFERILNLLYKNQKRWAFARDPNGALYNLVRVTGIDFDTYQKCINDEMLEAGIVTKMRKESAKHNIVGSPTFVVNDDYKISGSQSFPSFMDSFETYKRYVNNKEEK